MRFQAANEAPAMQSYFAHGPLAYTATNSYEAQMTGGGLDYPGHRAYASQENAIYTPPTPPESEAETLPQSAQSYRDSYPSHHHTPLAITTVSSTQLKLSRRNNPELERRRVHFCDSPGCTKGKLSVEDMTLFMMC